MNLRKAVICTLIPLIVLAIVLVGGCKSKDDTETSKTGTDIVAKVNGEPIYRQELVDELVKRYGNQVLNELIMKKLVEQEAKKQGITVTDDEINKYMSQMEKSMGGKESMDIKLKNANITRQDVVKDIRYNLLLKKLILKEIDENDKEIFYETKIKDKAPYVELWMIVVPTKELADVVKEKLQLGEDFAKMAKKYSLLTYQGIPNGYIGLINRYEVEADKLVPKQLARHIFNAKLNQVVGPILVERDKKKLYYIFKITQIKKTYEDFKEDIEDILASTKAQQYLNKLRERAEVENFLRNSQSKTGEKGDNK